MDGWPYVGGGAFCRPVGCADPFPMPGRDRDFSARRVLAMRAILSPPRKLWNIRRLAVAASGRGSMAHPPRKNRPLPLWSHFPPHHPNSIQLPPCPSLWPGGLFAPRQGRGLRLCALCTEMPHPQNRTFCCAGESAPSFPPCSAAAPVPHRKAEALSPCSFLPYFSEVFANWPPARYNKEYL